MINYVIGDATKPATPGAGMNFILHVCNDNGGWGKGFVLALSKRWPGPEWYYRNAESYEVGAVQLVPVEPGIVVANMVAQHGYASKERPVALSYSGLWVCLDKIRLATEHYVDDTVVFHMPRLGAGLAGGSWDKIEAIIQDTIGFRPCYVYDLPGF